MLRWLLKPKFFVCEYTSDKCNGQFACLATEFDDAIEEATAYVTNIRINGDYELTIRKATFIERIK